MTDAYWALREGEDLGAAIRKKVERGQRYILASGLWWLWVKAHNLMHGMGRDGYSSHSLEKKGKQGELTSFNVNHFRSIVRQYHNLAVGQRPTLDPVPENGAVDAETQARKARDVLEHYSRRGWKRAQADVTRYAARYGAGWEWKWWNARRGEETLPAMTLEEAAADAMAQGLPPEEMEAHVAQMTAPQYTGDFEFFAFRPNDVYFDTTLKSSRQIHWVVLRVRANRWDLMADFPERAEEIRSLKRASIDTQCDFSYMPGFGIPDHHEDDDTVCLYVLVHDKRPACPEGRLALCLSAGAPLLVDTLPAGVFAVRRLADDDFDDSAHGYSNAWDMMGLQEYINMAASIMASNQRTHGVSVIAAPKGSDVDATKIGQGQVLLKYNPGVGKPEAINFTSTPPEVINGMDNAVGSMERISGVNAVARGDPNASLRTGPALAIVKASAVETSIDFQTNTETYYDESASDLLVLFQRFATDAVRVAVTGETGVLTAEVKGDDILAVKAVRVDVGSPLSRTLAGKIEMATNLVTIAQQNGTPIDIGQYYRVLETGRIEDMTELDTKRRRNIAKENEMLAKARFIDGTKELDPSVPMPRALATDDVKAHVTHHLSGLDSPEARGNEAFVRATLQHVAEHVQASMTVQTSQPVLLEAAGLQPLQSIAGLMQAMGGAPPAQGAPQEAAAGQEQSAASAPQPTLPSADAMASGVNPEAPGPGGQAL